MIWEIILLGSLGLVSGLGLSLVSSKLKSDEGKAVEDIKEILPGTNCGACGYSGCEEYAKQLAEDPSKLGSCAVISDEDRKSLSELLEEES